ncbi:MAG TPA: AlpA family phage regulatory protein [Sphingomonas sp.]
MLGAVRLFGRIFADGMVQTFARPFGGGVPVPLGCELWELDDHAPRFLHSALALDAPWDTGARLTHWVFVDEDQWRELLERSCADVVPRGWRSPRERSRTADADGDAGATPSPMPEAFLRLPEVRARTGLARSTIYARMSRGEFPRQVDLDGNIAAWRETEVADWISSRG